MVLIAFGNPYIPLGLPESAAFISAYGPSKTVQLAVADALFGRAPITGRLPITIPERYAYGDGVSVTQQTLRRDAPEAVGFSPEVGEEIDAAIEHAIDQRVFPGATVAVGRHGALIHLAGYGHHTYSRHKPATPSARYDLASLTKVVATTAVAMKLYEEGRLDLDAPVSRYLPDFEPRGASPVTVRQLLAHQAGQRAFYPFYRDASLSSLEAIRRFIYTDTLQYAPGTDTRYSDFDMIVLGDVIEAVTKEPLDRYVEERLFAPLGMKRTGFIPVGVPDTNAVPTEYDATFRKRLIHGEVHDEAAWLLGGVAGHAGLFSTAEDLSRFAFVLLNDGEGYGSRHFKPETIELFTRRVTTPGAYPAALGWASWRPPEEGPSSGGRLLSPRAFGHTGFTGTSIWLDPEKDIFIILLTNRVHPSRDSSAMGAVRSALADVVAGALQTSADTPFSIPFGLPPDDLVHP